MDRLQKTLIKPNAQIPMANGKIPMQLPVMVIALERLQTPSELFTHVSKSRFWPIDFDGGQVENELAAVGEILQTMKSGVAYLTSRSSMATQVAFGVGGAELLTCVTSNIRCGGREYLKGASFCFVVVLWCHTLQSRFHVRRGQYQPSSCLQQR